MKLVNLKPPQIAWILLGLGAGLHFLLPTAYRGNFGCWVCGVVGIGTGFGVMIWSWTLFRRAGSMMTIPRYMGFLENRNGPERTSVAARSVGRIGVSGVAAWVGSVPMLIAPIGFFVFMSAVFIPYEESRLREGFGDEYVSYAEKVRRWV